MGLLQPKYWLRNLNSGVMVGIIALPLAMAFAIASGLKPEQGLYTAIISGFIVAIFGGSRVQIAGPTGAFVVILANITAEYGVSGLQIATVLAGAILVLLGILRLGNIIRFIPNTVIVGFTSGIAVIIFVGQWKDFLGLSQSPVFTSNMPAILPKESQYFHDKITEIFMALPNCHLQTILLGCVTLVLIIILSRFAKRLPVFLIAMSFTTLLQYFVQFEDVATLGSFFGEIPNHLPAFQPLDFSIEQCFILLGPAFSIALLGAIESLLAATVADKMIKDKHDSNQELIGQGLANLIAPFFGGFASTGAIARTAANVRNGGTNPLAAIAHSITLVLIILLFAPLTSYIPLCSLSAILFVVAYNMSESKHFIDLLKKSSKEDIWVLMTTFFLTVFVDLIIAVNVGVILALIFKVKTKTNPIG